MLAGKIIGVSVRLCDDLAASVSAMSAQSLASVGSKLSSRISEKQLWPEHDALMKNRNHLVRAAAMRVVA